MLLQPLVSLQSAIATMIDDIVAATLRFARFEERDGGFGSHAESGEFSARIECSATKQGFAVF